MSTEEKLVLSEFDNMVAVHVTPKIDETCDHEWMEDGNGEPLFCVKCHLSFTRYIFSCCP